MNNHVLRTGAFILLSVKLLACSAGADNESDKKEKQAALKVPVVAASVEKKDVHAYYASSASLEAKEQADVVAKVRGQLLNLMFEEGDVVTAGTVLATLDIERNQLELARVTANLKKLEKELARSRTMFRKGLIPKEQLERLQFDFAALEADHELMSLNVKDGNIRSPIDGVISHRYVKKGNMVNVNDRLFTITQFSPLQAVLHVPENFYQKMQSADRATIAVDALKDKGFDAKVKRVSPTIDSETGTFKVTVEVSNQDRKLKPGMFSRVKILYETHANTLVVNRNALMTTSYATEVFKIDNDIAYRQKVVTGFVDGENVEIIDGLALDDKVVISGQNNLKNESPVTISSL